MGYSLFRMRRILAEPPINRISLVMNFVQRAESMTPIIHGNRGYILRKNIALLQKIRRYTGLCGSSRLPKEAGFERSSTLRVHFAARPASRQPSRVVTALISVYSSTAAKPISRPQPDSL